MKKSTLKRFIGMPHFEEHMALHLADCQASHGMTKAYDFIMEKFDEFEDEEMRIGNLKAQTGWAIDEATAKNLLSQAKLKKALENVEPDSVEYNKIDKALKELRTNWGELNYLKKATFWNPQPWDDDWEFMELLISLVQKVRGLN